MAEDVASKHLGGASLTAIVPDIDIRTLDEKHVIPNIGPVVFRGVWFPRLNL
jgi:hypothetical protein